MLSFTGPIHVVVWVEPPACGCMSISVVSSDETRSVRMEGRCDGCSFVPASAHGAAVCGALDLSRTGSTLHAQLSFMTWADVREPRSRDVTNSIENFPLLCYGLSEVGSPCGPTAGSAYFR